MSGLVTTIALLVNRSTSLTMHQQKLNADRELAERKFAFDKTLAEHKVAADIALAEKKFAFDRDVVTWRRRYELADQLLKLAYETRDALNWARVRVILSGEGETREATKPESEKLKAARNSAYVPIERLLRNSNVFSALQAERYAFITHFGEQASAPISAILGAHQQITTAATSLGQWVEVDEGRDSRESLEPLREVLWGCRPDAIDKEVNGAVEQLEAICSPVLSGRPPA